MRSFGFQDCWEVAGRPKPLKTCRFDTRIDYIFATDAVFRSNRLLSVRHIEDSASDHNMVIATFAANQ